MRVNLKMLLRALERTDIPDPEYDGQTLNIYIDTYKSYLQNAHLVANNKHEPVVTEFVCIHLIAVEYRRCDFNTEYVWEIEYWNLK